MGIAGDVSINNNVDVQGFIYKSGNNPVVVNDALRVGGSIDIKCIMVEGRLAFQSDTVSFLKLPPHSSPPVVCNSANHGAMYLDSGGTGSGGNTGVCLCSLSDDVFSWQRQDDVGHCQ